MLNKMNFFIVFCLIQITLNNNLLSQDKKDVFVIGFSQCTTDDLWRQTMDFEMQNELIYYPSIQLIIKDAKNSSEKQIRDIKALIEENIDLLIVSPNESEPLTEIVQEVFRKGIPVILIDRKITSSEYTSFLGGNNYEIGREAGKYAVEYLKGNGKIIEITGLQGSSPAKERQKGFLDEIKNHPGIRIIQSLSGDWKMETGRQLMEQIIESGLDFDLVYAHNDVMAIGASNVFNEKQLSKKVFFIGVDGSPGPNGGLQAVMDKVLDATLLYPTGGSFAISLAWKILQKEPFLKDNILNTLVIDSTNVKALKYQTDEIINLNERISLAKKNLDLQYEKYYSQQFWLISALVSLFLVILLAILLLRAFRNKLRDNSKLEQQKKEIIRQNSELMRISSELEDASRAKLVFFTNISHEFRTPLTLIIGPLENILENAKLTQEDQHQLKLMLRNAHRLLRLINQLMDLRKIDNDKMRLQAGLNDLVLFISEVKEAFNEMAAKKKIEFVFTSEMDEFLLYFDQDKLDKILFNLLSNAFKFTSASGFVGIHLRKTKHYFENELREAAEIEISDNGPGIPIQFHQQIFERFYQVDQQDGSIFPGTGIGLPLTKDFVRLHKGDITLNSKVGVGTSFFIYFQTGNSHLSENEIISNTQQNIILDKGVIKNHEIPELQQTYNPIQNSKVDYEDKPLILVVEDNPDVTSFIKSSLTDQYRIMTASNGAEAFEKMYIEEPGLIISDVMMPIMDGLVFTKKLKSDIRTSHIPIILLTARISYEQKLEGIETGADSYIPKPFNTKHLQVRVKQLLENRQRIRKYYQSDPLFLVSNELKISELDNNFLKKCAAIIESHLTENEFTVEQLSSEIGLSRVHVYRKIKHLTGFSVSEFVRNIKLKKATLLLLESGKNVAEVAYELGFSSPSYFSKCFKEQYNVSPSEYVQQKSGRGLSL
jgi:signal transduction histidine kinase/DNA-binding response OmpR family regulator/ABC-type xylose transport system substrate-binding protein